MAACGSFFAPNSSLSLAVADSIVMDLKYGEICHSTQ